MSRFRLFPTGFIATTTFILNISSSTLSRDKNRIHTLGSVMTPHFTKSWIIQREGRNLAGMLGSTALMRGLEADLCHNPVQAQIDHFSK